MPDPWRVARGALGPCCAVAVATAILLALRTLISSSSTMGQKASVVFGVVLYACVVRWMRARRLAYLEGVEDLHELGRVLARVEFAEITYRALELALFRTYAIPSVSALLERTGRFTESAESCLRRYNDTDLILSEIFERDQDHPRSILALRRLNFIHSHYKISNDDYLFTLSLFMVEPVAWINRYGWRALSQREADAFFELFRTMGVRMGIRGIPGNIAEMARWKDRYAQKHSRFAKSNRAIGDATFALLLKPVPAFAKPFALHASYALMNDPLLLEAMGYPLPSRAFVAAMDGIMRARAAFVRYLLPPRPLWFNANRTPAKASERTGLFEPNFSRYGQSYPGGYAIGRLGPDELRPGLLGKLHGGEE
uniref:ER-bound oxygenase mpaB/mpaB'/Rubber oxygenase catalytic domain-containing protein n=1 Tax=Lotharella oceanica TaxID=641309 RepID=A0A7S2TV75_9EUKA|mmetsp:Transcript_31384/g.58527  ORF Transcript_31384/g.58527 Transcript_31384/m.58527 type:complete len:369 (+) Transcript_31384:185-1291(+)|eukprot:CAMPEP_0170174406 /NCGR_PEP_ID=MMETSP0040_2-20121228/7630_1 /TAXON_ID=641309 /ORGANISM="Lotharella oceanica, Strain CCMP622" /LENGTH=368 /DNA_ID=CAMNT_0010416027 /DNA_START=128 /DNA_END=1234 /DNA_ORIENTATION=-